MSKRRIVLWSVFLTILAGCIAGATVFLLVVLGGAYNVAASEPHVGLVKWTHERTADSSVERRAEAIERPGWFADAEVETGFASYDAMCFDCHGGPNLDGAEWSVGLNPEAPDLVEEVEDMTAKEVFWIVKHGIRMTGMPAFGATHSDEALWTLTAYVQTLPGATREEYLAMREDAPGHGETSEHEHEDAGRTDETPDMQEGTGDAAGRHEPPGAEETPHPHEGTDETSQHEHEDAGGTDETPDMQEGADEAAGQHETSGAQE